eukprot:TRINITY_DN1975_c0_g1_i2.p1 TRINITY_DN1975_c0_g1~~TRINITY_DN1975_c0_g1_i2.p1  ORF type:complete len:538 (+),score=93.47 TRINITY_DN1975_c0_g1_i2:664-2277(+)
MSCEKIGENTLPEAVQNNMFSLRVHTQALVNRGEMSSSAAAMEESTSTSAIDDLFSAFGLGSKSVVSDAFSKGDDAGPVKSVGFSSGNPRVEEIRGVMHLFRNLADPPQSVDVLPVNRSTLVCVLAVPNYMTYADFCQFSGVFIDNILQMRIVRNDGLSDRYSIIMTFDDQKSADDFYRHYNQKPFSSLEAEICHVLFVADVQYTGSFEHAGTPPAGLTEIPTCPVCLERLDSHISGILTTVCNHSFHSSCISKWADSSCPVCRYCQQQPEKSTCSVCSTAENLWICLICGFVGCGRYQSGHAINHWKESQHCYSLEVESQRVWNYVGDNYVHRLIQSKTDGKLVELNAYCREGGDACGRCECSHDSGFENALFNSKMEAIADEYNKLLTSQLENQRQYFDQLLAEAQQQRDAAIAEAIQKATNVKIQKLQAKVEKLTKDNSFLSEVNRNLVGNQELWKKKIEEMEEREKSSIRLRDEKISELEEQVRDLMIFIETQKTIEKSPQSADIRDGTIMSIQTESTSKSNRRSGKTNRKKH